MEGRFSLIFMRGSGIGGPPQRDVFIVFFKDIEILAIILVPLIMTLSRGHTGQIKGQS